MDGFLLLALVAIYLAISYVPSSQAPKNTWQSNQNEHTTHSKSETDGTRLP
jgi:hypothetical protein